MRGVGISSPGMKKQVSGIVVAFLCGSALSLFAGEPGEVLVFEDNFDREETQTAKDEPGNDWTTNSEARAKGDEIRCAIDEEQVKAFTSEGFAHPRKTKLRLHVARSLYLDDLRIWKHGD